MKIFKDGGPAFPSPEWSDAHGNVVPVEYGMSLRDYFAAKAMQGLLAVPFSEGQEHPVFLISDGLGFRDGFRGRIAVAAYTMADAMLKARGS